MPRVTLTLRRFLPQELVLGFISDIFSFSKVRFTTIEALAEDILALAREKSEVAAERLKVDGLDLDITPTNVTFPSQNGAHQNGVTL